MATKDRFWYIFGNCNWHDGGNSAEQYARTISKIPCIYVHGAKSRARRTYNRMRIIPQSMADAFLEEKTNKEKASLTYIPEE